MPNPQATARKLQRRIRGYANTDGRYYEQPARHFWPADQELPLAYLRRRDWRRCWWLSETALLAEAGTGMPFNGIHWDEPAREPVLHYARTADA